MRKIGLIGEDPNDTQALRNLLSQAFNEIVQFKIVLRNIKGHHLDSAKTFKALQTELAYNEFYAIIFIRDLDGLENETQKLREKLVWFNRVNALSDNKGLFLLNIYELEALILADMEAFNKEYKTRITGVGDVMFKIKPKEFLISKTHNFKKPYHESHCPELFKKLRYKVVESNCKYFENFSNLLYSRLKIKNPSAKRQKGNK